MLWSLIKILLFVGIASYQVMADQNVTAQPGSVEAPANTVEVEVVGQKYFWTYDYPNQPMQGGEGNVSAQNTMVVPTDRPIVLKVTSKDWLHSFHVPGLGLKKDAFPGQYNTILTKANNEGQYQLYCAEYCGAGHAGMLGEVNTTSQESFETWLADQVEE